MTRFLSLLLSAVLLLTACGKPAEIANPSSFKSDGIAFEYPSNWRVTETTKIEVGTMIRIEESGNALTMLTIFAASQQVALDTYANAFSSSLKDSFAGRFVTSEGVSNAGTGVDVRFSIGVLGETVPHTANITLHRLGALDVICLTQVADEDRHYVQPGFDLLRRTLKSGG